VEVAKVQFRPTLALAHLVQVQKARRWRAGRRGDEALVEMLTERIAYLEKAAARSKPKVDQRPRRNSVGACLI
jgi:hypothetical protein